MWGFLYGICMINQDFLLCFLILSMAKRNHLTFTGDLLV